MTQRLRVLVVEDDDSSRRVLESAILSFGYDCQTAKDGLEAWGIYQAGHVDVILSDWQMPRMDGLELCKRTRSAQDDRAYTYFIFMTSFADKSHLLRGMEAGADDYQTKPLDLDELQARLVSAERVVTLYRQLAEKNSRLRRESQSSFKAARIDALTGIANRLHLNEDLGALWAQANRYGHRYSAAMCDIDWFKAYNDHFGHLAGDAVLRQIAQTFRQELRRGDMLYRYGGEEFVVIFPEQGVSEAARAAERMRRAVEATAIRTTAGNGVVTVSIGVAELVPGDESAETWLARADSALYEAKSKGRNQVAVHARPTSSPSQRPSPPSQPS